MPARGVDPLSSTMSHRSGRPPTDTRHPAKDAAAAESPHA